MKLEAVELHSTIFLSGINLGPKLPKERRDLELSFDGTSNMVVIKLKDKTALVPLANVACMIPAPEVRVVKNRTSNG